MSGTHTIIQELLLFRVVEGRLHCRVERVSLPVGQRPDVHVRGVLGWTEDSTPNGAMLHSTSWRANPDQNELVLTWAIIPDPAPSQPSHPVGEPTIAQGRDGSHPVPDDLDVSHVIAHAARHLAFLSHTDPAVQDAIHHHPQMHDALLAFAPDVAINATHPDS